MRRQYRTHDLSAAAYLLLNGYTLQGIVDAPGGGRLQEFTFESDPALDHHLQAYFDGAAVPARRYASTISRLKTAMYRHLKRESYELSSIVPPAEPR